MKLRCLDDILHTTTCRLSYSGGDPPLLSGASQSQPSIGDDNAMAESRQRLAEPAQRLTLPSQLSIATFVVNKFIGIQSGVFNAGHSLGLTNFHREGREPLEGVHFTYEDALETSRVSHASYQNTSRLSFLLTCNLLCIFTSPSRALISQSSALILIIAASFWWVYFISPPLHSCLLTCVAADRDHEQSATSFVVTWKRRVPAKMFVYKRGKYNLVLALHWCSSLTI